MLVDNALWRSIYFFAIFVILAPYFTTNNFLNATFTVICRKEWEESHSRMTPLIAQLSIVKARAWAREQVFKVSIVGMDRLERAILKQTKGINGVDT